MSDKPYLIFKLHGQHYGIAAIAVEEVFLLPEIYTTAQLAAPFVGVMNLRGTILPIADLSPWLRHAPQPYSLNDSIIVLIGQGQHMGIIANQVLGIESLVANPWATPPTATLEQTTGLMVPTQFATLDETLFSLLEAEDLLAQLSDRLRPEALPPFDSLEPTPTPPTAIAPTLPPLQITADPAEQAILQQRAANLRSPLETGNTAEQLFLAVVQLRDEYFGLEVSVINEFTDIRTPTRIPCVPPHILGNMNLRGEILTLIDISHVLNLPPGDRSQRHKAVVVRLDDVVAGIVVDEVFDVVSINASDLRPVPIAVRTTHDLYLRGIAPYGDRTMTVLDLPNILHQGELVVNETI